MDAPLSGFEATSGLRRTKRIAFVLSGGGNRGALEVGGLLALLEHGIQPQILVGTSVGAINAAAIASNPTVEGIRWLAEVWRGVTKEAVVPNRYPSMLWRLVTGKSGLFANQNLRNFLASHFPEGVRRFADIKATELYITAVDLQSGGLHVFGIDRSESILDALMASTALPPFLCPWQYRGQQYIDGGVVSHLPVRVAVEMNATQIFAIDVGQHRRVKGRIRGVFHIIRQIVDDISSQQLMDELGWVEKVFQGEIHHMGINAFEQLRLWDFSHTAEMIEIGRQKGLEYLREHDVAAPA